MSKIKQILVVEDNPPELELMCYLLRSFGYETKGAMTGEEALALAAGDPPDLVLCDLRLPGMDGYEVTHRLRREPRMQGKSIVAVSASLRPGDEDTVRAKGFDGQILKPLVAEQFVGQIKAFLAVESGGEQPARPPEESSATHGQQAD